MINHGKYLERFKKLNWVDDETLLNAENLNRLEEFIDLLDLRTRSEVGDVIDSSTYTDMQQVINRYGGTYWALINKPLGVYNTWLRTDVDPSTTPQKSYRGMAVIVEANKFSENQIQEIYGGSKWVKINNDGNFDIWRCTNHSESAEEKLSCFEGMISFSFLPYKEFINKTKGEWKEVKGFKFALDDENIMHQYICTYADLPNIGLGSYVGLISLSNNLDTDEKVKLQYDGTPYSGNEWDGFVTSAVKQWIRNA